jgi:hypothetical protein
MIIERPALLGRRSSTGVVPIVTASTLTLLYQIPAGRTIEVKKIAITNRYTATTEVTVQQSASVTGSSPSQVGTVQYVATAASVEIREADIPREPQGITGYLFAEASATGAAPTEVQIEIEFEEYPAGGIPSN